MSSQNLSGRTIAILVADGFSESEFLAIRERLHAEGATTMVVSPTSGPIGRVAGWAGQDWGDEIPVDVPVVSAIANDFDAAVVPGGGASADCIRTDAASGQFLQHFLDEARPVGLVGEALRVAIGFNMTKGRRAAAPSELGRELDAAGIAWADEPFVTDTHLITCRSSADLDLFLEHFVAEVAALPMRPARVAPVSQRQFVSGGRADHS